jgi:hypothetical protein
MSDKDTSLPIRSEDDADERVLTKIQDGDDPAGVGKTAEVSEKKLHTRVHGKDSDDADQEILLSQEGHVQSNGDYDAALNKRPSSQATILHDRKNTAELPAEEDQNKRPTAVAYDNGVDETVVAADVAIRDHNGVPWTEENPLPTYQAEKPSDEVEDFHDSGDIDNVTPSTHEYIVSVGKTLKNLKVFGSASGKAKWELKVETAVGSATFVTVAIGFNSTAQPNLVVPLEYKKTIAAGVKVQVVKTNRDKNDDFSVYSQVTGDEI